MLAQKKYSSLALGFALTLTFCVILIKGSALKWASLSWVVLCSIALTVLLLKRVSGPTKKYQLLTKSAFNVLSPAYLFIAFQLWALLQYALISPDKPASLDQSLIGLGMLFLLAIWWIAVRDSKALTLLFAFFVLSAAMQSFYGLWVYLSGAEQLLWMPKVYYLDRPTGFFVNANHFAAYLVLGIILCLSKMMANSPSAYKRSAIIGTFDRLYDVNSVILGLLIITLIASKSIGAMVALSVVVVLIAFEVAKRSQKRKALMIGMIALCLILFLVVLSLDYSFVKSLTSNLSHTFYRRLELSKAAFIMLENTWLTGIGGGAFYSQFSPYRTLEIGNTYYNYAHNDILQFWIEYGLIGVSLLVLFLATLIRDNIRILSQSRSGIQATFAYASIYSTLAVAIHSLVDFPLHIPGFSVCYLVIISVNSLSLINRSQFNDAANRT
jgi:O-antigen ligase